MKRLLLIVLMASLLLGMATATVWAAPGGGNLSQGGDPDTTSSETTDTSVTQEGEQGDEGTASSLEKAIGTLGLFAAMMAVLALGTEVVIDTTKFMIGLKSKPTALEALEKFGDQLPGQLSELGVSGKEVSRLEDVIAEMKEVLETLEYPVNLTQALREGDLGDAIEAAEAWAKAAKIDPNASKQAIIDSAQTGIHSLAARLGVDGTAVANTIASNVTQALERLGVDDVATTELMRSIQSEVPKLGQAWLEGQIEALKGKSLEERRTEIMKRFDADVAPTLNAIGLGDSRIQTLRDHIDTGLAKAAGQLHLKALENLLQGVEDVRFDVQSPLRKTWRRLRDSKFPPLVQWINAIRRRRKMRPLDPEGDWSEFLGNLRIGKPFELLERFWNFLLGRTPEGGVDGLGKADRVQPLTNATAAQRLLHAETKHQDEATSRVRVLRVISIFVGVYLAFRLQVNAVDILKEAFEGIAKINETVNTQVVVGWLNWPLEQLNKLPLINFKVFPLYETALEEGAEPALLLANKMRLDAGILLSGLAASAGSAFWHDQLGRLQVAKKAATQVQKVVASVKET